MERLIDVKFTRTNTVHGGNRRPYTVYEIEVSCKLTHGWIISKRYGLFFTLHQDLLKELKLYPEIYKSVKSLPILPPKRLTRSMASEFVEKRKLELYEYLTNILSYPELVRSSIVMNFLQVPEAFKHMFTQSLADYDAEIDNDFIDDDLKLKNYHTHSSTYNPQEIAINKLLKVLSTESHVLSNRVAAIKQFEQYFFDERPHLSSSDIIRLMIGISSKTANNSTTATTNNDTSSSLSTNNIVQKGLIQSCGDFKYSHIASSASLSLLCRLLDIERNKDAEQFLKTIVHIDGIYLKQMQLTYHIIEEKSLNRLNAFRLLDMLTSYDINNMNLSIEHLVHDTYAREYYIHWKKKNMNIISADNHTLLFANKNKDFVSEDTHEKALSNLNNDQIINLSHDTHQILYQHAIKLNDKEQQQEEEEEGQQQKEDENGEEEQQQQEENGQQGHNNK